jgi:hypothetical protein
LGYQLSCLDHLLLVAVEQHGLALYFDGSWLVFRQVCQRQYGCPGFRL